MWPLPPIQYKQIIVHSNESSCAIGVLEIIKQRLTLTAYLRTELESNTQSALLKVIDPFIKNHHLEHALFSIALSAPVIYEELRRCSKATPELAELSHQSLQKLLWDYRYMHALDDGNHLFYITGISRATLFQYQLIAGQQRLYLNTISSAYAALIQAYRALYASAFRQSQLSLDMIRTNYQLEQSISTDSIARMLSIPASVTVDMEQEKLSLLTMIGLYNQERVM